MQLLRVLDLKSQIVCNVLKIYCKYFCNNKIIKYSLVHETFYYTANKSKDTPATFLISGAFKIFPLFFPCLIQDFTINAAKQLEAELTSKPSLQDTNFSYLQFCFFFFFRSNLLCWMSFNEMKREYIALPFSWKFSNILVLQI